MGGVPLDGIVELEQAEYDRLPIGVIELDQAGVVLSFNAHQAQRRGLRRVHVVGQRFFEDVAPCTQGPAFQGRFDALVASGEARSERFEFIFRFATGDLLVKVAMASDPSRARVVLLINDR
jgi:photoactive yellow protein